jgi:hypothetical protein
MRPCRLARCSAFRFGLPWKIAPLRVRNSRSHGLIFCVHRLPTRRPTQRKRRLRYITPKTCAATIKRRSLTFAASANCVTRRAFALKCVALFASWARVCANSLDAVCLPLSYADLCFCVAGTFALVCASTTCCHGNERGYHLAGRGTVSQNIHSEARECQVSLKFFCGGVGWSNFFICYVTQCGFSDIHQYLELKTWTKYQKFGRNCVPA